jgi:hypothetical protein
LAGDWVAAGALLPAGRHVAVTAARPSAGRFN